MSQWDKLTTRIKDHLRFTLFVVGAVVGAAIALLVASGLNVSGETLRLASPVVGAIVGGVAGLITAVAVEAPEPDDQIPGSGTAPARAKRSWGDAGVGRVGILILSVLIIVVSVSLLTALVLVWPGPGAPIEAIVDTEDASRVANIDTKEYDEYVALRAPLASGDPELTESQRTRLASFRAVHGADVAVRRDQALLLAVTLTGALGAMGHVSISFYRFVGSRRLMWSWIPSYFLTPIVGALLAGITYVLIRAGLLTGGVSGDPYGLIAIAALVGLFSSQAMAKLKLIFESVFTATEPGADALDDPKPVIESVVPDSGGPGQAVTITGSGFIGATKVIFPGGKESVATPDADGKTLTTKVPEGVTNATEALGLRYASGIIVTEAEFTSVPEETVAAEELTTGEAPLPVQTLPAGVTITEVVPTSGEAGGSVTLVGTGLQVVTHVIFPDAEWVPATVAGDGTSLSAVVPDDASSGPVNVGIGGTEFETGQEFTIEDS